MGSSPCLRLMNCGDVFHRSWTIEGVHGNEVLEGAGMEFAQVLLHAGRLELEGADGASVAIEVVGGGIFDVEQVDVDFNAERVADIFDGFAQDRKGFESEEVHLDESGFFDDLTFVLGAVEFFAGFLVVGGADGHPIADIVAADDEATGVDTGVAHCYPRAFSHIEWCCA